MSEERREEADTEQSTEVDRSESLFSHSDIATVSAESEVLLARHTQLERGEGGGK